MRTNKLIIASSASILIWVASGCNIYGKFEMPENTAITKEYKEAKEAQQDSTAFGNLRWEEVFTDPVLADLITRALENNKDLKNAKLNVDIAHAQVQGARLSYLPSLALSPNGALSKYADGAWGKTYQIPAAVSWEIDVFAKILNTKRGAEANYRYADDYRQAVKSQIIAGVANCYYSLVALENQLVLSRETATLWSQNIKTMQDLKLAGQVTEAAVVQSQAQYYSILGSITDLETSLAQTNNAMSLLMNEMPQKWTVNPSVKLTIPEIYREAVPMRELAARPDVRAAEESLAAAYYTTAGARAAFYPSLNITANGGFTNLLGSMIKNPGEFFIQLAGQLTVPIFSRGANIARLKAAKAQQEQALNNFEYTVMSASAEVSNAMTTYNNTIEKMKYLSEQIGYLSKSVDITEELLTVGGYYTTYLEVLTAQQSLLSAQMALITCELTKSQAVVNLYQSLGGGR